MSATAPHPDPRRLDHRLRRPGPPAPPGRRRRRRGRLDRARGAALRRDRRRDGRRARPRPHPRADLDPRPHRGLAARPLVHRGRGQPPVLVLGPVRDAARAGRSPGRGGRPGLRRLLDGRAAAGRRARPSWRSAAWASTSIERAAHYGLRVYMGLAFRSGRWLTRDGKRVEWEWDEAAGREGLRRAVQFHKQHDGAHGDLVRCFFAPAQIDTCTPELCARPSAGRRGRRCPYQVHASQSVVEFIEMLGRHGKTPVAWMDEMGVLGPQHDPGPRHHRRRLLVDQLPAPATSGSWPTTGASVAHAVWVFAAARRRHGVVRPLQGGRREHVARDRHQPAERDRGDALGGGVLEDRGAQHPGHHRRRRLRRGDPGRCSRPRPRRPRPHRAGRQGRPRALEGARRGP